MQSKDFSDINSFIQYAYTKAPAVRDIFDRAGLNPDEIRTALDLERVPVTSKDRLVELQRDNPPFGGFLAVPTSELQHIFLSPGPIYEPHASESAILDTVREVCQIAGFKAGDVVINTFGYHLIPTGLAVDQVLREAGITVLAAGVGNAELQLKLMADLNVTGYVGTPSWLMALIKKAEEMGLDFRKNFLLRKSLVSAEPLPPSLRQAFVEQYGLSVANAYGTAELGFLAVNTEGGLMMHLLESSILQVANPEDGKTVASGEAGEVVVTSLNRTYPLVRLGTGDLAVNVDPAPGQSRQSERAIILVGRVGDAVKVRGMFVHPNQLRFAVGQVPGVAKFQANVNRVENRDEFSLSVVLSGEHTDQGALRESISAAVQSTCRVKVDRIDFVQDLEGEALVVDSRSWD